MNAVPPAVFLVRQASTCRRKIGELQEAHIESSGASSRARVQTRNYSSLERLRELSIFPLSSTDQALATEI
jgi:hypothetical protein